MTTRLVIGFSTQLNYLLRALQRPMIPFLHKSLVQLVSSTSLIPRTNPLCTQNGHQSGNLHSNLPTHSSKQTDVPPFPQKHGASGDTLLNSTELPAQSSANTEHPHNCSSLPVESSASGEVSLQACVLIDNFLDPEEVPGLTNIKTSPTDSSLPLVCTETNNLTKKNIILINLLPSVFTLPTDSSLPVVCTETNNVLTDTNMGDEVSAFKAEGSGSNRQQDDNPNSTANTFFCTTQTVTQLNPAYRMFQFQLHVLRSVAKRHQQEVHLDPENQQLNLEDQQHYPEHQPKQLNPEHQPKQLNPEN
ncbi:hypothetical protein KEM48_013092 [Puccinia striiformis f. sp. tritici PST-130]|nr:hypothetical protein Pst134EB_012748 [Puccinia striiformis f. sp. tritici]KAI9629298.1 hypothetical protein KEM48_013092 [Puccinia striiformis f. sp. tritici PST-130]